MTTTIESNEAEMKRIAERIIQICEAAFSEGKPYVLLSRIGLDLGQDVQRIKYITGRGLADFVSKYDALKCYTVLPVSGTTNVFAIVRASIAQRGVGESIQSASVAPQTSEARYHYRFWAAFAVPPTSGAKRYFDPINFLFKDLQDDEGALDGWLLIDEEYIAPEGADKRDLVIKQNVDRWLSKTGNDRSRFLQNAKSSGVAQRNLLFAVIEALDRRQLQETNLSLDVVATLANKKF